MGGNKKIIPARVAVAMSGGVDSAVSAALLKIAGFEVVGIFIKLWVDEACGTEAQNRCCTEKSEQRARTTALQLGINFYVLDLRREFKQLVADPFLCGSKGGLTPNPCVVCNEAIKFGLLIEKAQAFGADHIATGHYAQIKKTRNGLYRLLKGKDKDKDQSYFLWRLSQEQLGRIIFPVGCFQKSEVRRMARAWKLPSAKTPESQEICFANGDIDGFLARYCGRKGGNIVDAAGKVIGRHDGLWFYTIGQRKGIKLAGGPYYVAKKDALKNELVVAASRKNVVSSRIVLDDVRWLSGSAPRLPKSFKSKIRYRSKEAVSVLRASAGGKLELEFAAPQTAPAPGQSAVFYVKNEVVGGGVIAL